MRFKLNYEVGVGLVWVFTLFYVHGVSRSGLCHDTDNNMLMRHSQDMVRIWLGGLVRNEKRF